MAPHKLGDLSLVPRTHVKVGPQRCALTLKHKHAHTLIHENAF